ncbi:hypothetical protein [Nitrospira sp. Nam74]
MEYVLIAGVVVVPTHYVGECEDAGHHESDCRFGTAVASRATGQVRAVAFVYTPHL